VLDERGLNLSCRQSVSGDVHDIINTSADPVVSLVVTSSTVSGELLSLAFEYYPSPLDKLT
jgi:hypothetical protein